MLIGTDIAQLAGEDENVALLKNEHLLGVWPGRRLRHAGEAVQVGCERGLYVQADVAGALQRGEAGAYAESGEWDGGEGRELDGGAGPLGGSAYHG